MSRNTADCIAVVGASGTGKGVYCCARIIAAGLDARPLLVWSPLEATDRYGKKFAAPVVRSIGDMVKAVKAGRRRVVLLPSARPKELAAQFDLFCRIAWAVPGAVVLVEELSRVTSPGFAPQPWQNLSTAGRHRGLTVIATAQRPAQVDKDFLGNCTELRAYRVMYENDARALASITREPFGTFLELPDLHYVHRYMRERRTVKGIQPLPGAEKKSSKKTPRASRPVTVTAP